MHFPNDSAFNELIAFRDSLLFFSIKNSDSLELFNDYIYKYSQSEYYDSTIKIRDQIAFDIAIKNMNILEINDFIFKYPYANQIDSALIIVRNIEDEIEEKILEDSLQKKQLELNAQIIELLNDYLLSLPDSVNFSAFSDFKTWIEYENNTVR